MDPQTASNGKRVIAYLIDLGTVFIVDALLSMYIRLPNQMSQLLVSFILSFVVIPLIYWVYVPLNFGATLGKSMLGLKVISQDGTPPTWGQMLKRESIGRSASIIVFGLGFMWCLVNPKGYTWHDILSKTRVVKN